MNIVFDSNTIKPRFMGQRQNINTVRFTAEENKQIETYLKQNLIFDSFSSLARIATLGFIGQAQKFHLQPLADQKRHNKNLLFSGTMISMTIKSEKFYHDLQKTTPNSGY